MTTTPSITATRIRRGSKARIVITLDGVQLAELGGARAERAAAVVVSDWFRTYPNDRYSAECRSSMAAAKSHAKAIMAPMMRHGGATFPRTNPDWVVAVPVEEVAS